LSKYYIAKCTSAIVPVNGLVISTLIDYLTRSNAICG
jgi:hypothetical protein